MASMPCLGNRVRLKWHEPSKAARNRLSLQDDFSTRCYALVSIIEVGDNHHLA